MSPIFIIFWGVVILVVVIVGAKIAYGEESPPQINTNTTLPNKTGTLEPALCCHQYGEGNEWGDLRK